MQICLWYNLKWKSHPKNNVLSLYIYMCVCVCVCVCVCAYLLTWTFMFFYWSKWTTSYVETLNYDHISFFLGKLWSHIYYTMFGSREKGKRESGTREIEEKWQFLRFGILKKLRREIKYWWVLPLFCFSSK